MCIFLFLPFCLTGKAQIINVWLHEMFVNCMHSCNQPTLRQNVFSKSYGVPSWLFPHLKENQHLTSNLRYSNPKFLKHWVSDIYKSGNLHFCHPLRNQVWQSWVCVFSPGCGMATQEQLSLKVGVKGMQKLIYQMQTWLKSYKEIFGL